MFFYRVFTQQYQNLTNTKLPFAQKKLILKQWAKKVSVCGLATILTEG